MHRQVCSHFAGVLAGRAHFITLLSFLTSLASLSSDLHPAWLSLPLLIQSLTPLGFLNCFIIAIVYQVLSKEESFTPTVQIRTLRFVDVNNLLLGTPLATGSTGAENKSVTWRLILGTSVYHTASDLMKTFTVISMVDEETEAERL